MKRNLYMKLNSVNASTTNYTTPNNCFGLTLYVHNTESFLPLKMYVILSSCELLSQESNHVLLGSQDMRLLVSQ